MEYVLNYNIEFITNKMIFPLDTLTLSITKYVRSELKFPQIHR